MTNAESEDIVTVSSDGVTVEKSFEPDEFPVPAIAFALRSDRETAVSIRLTDSVPDDVAPENIGFHPKYGAEFWGIEDDRIVFERELTGGEEYTTVYGLRGGSEDREAAMEFMSEPTIESVQPPLSDSEEAAPEAGSDETVENALDTAQIDAIDPPEGDTTDRPDQGGPTDIAVNGDDVAEPEDDDEEPTEPDADSGSEDADADTNVDGEETKDHGSDTVPVEEDDADPEPADPHEPIGSEPHIDSERDSVVAGLAAEIRANDADDDDLLELRDALGLDMATASVEARIEHLQSETSDLRAYTDALEEFLDEEGDAQTLIEDAQEGYEETAERVAELEAELEDTRTELDERFEAIERRLESIDETIEDRLESELDGIRSEIDTVERRVETEADARSELESDIESLSAELAEVSEMRDRLTNALSGLAGGIQAGTDDTDAEPESTEPSAEDDGDGTEE